MATNSGHRQQLIGFTFVGMLSKVSALATNGEKSMIVQTGQSKIASISTGACSNGIDVHAKSGGGRRVRSNLIY